MDNSTLKTLLQTSNKPVRLTVEQFKQMAVIEIDSVETVSYGITDLDLATPRFEYMTENSETKYTTDYRIVFPIENDDDLVIHLSDMQGLNNISYDIPITERTRLLNEWTVNAIAKALLARNIELVS